MSMASVTKPRFVTNRMCPFAQKAWIALELSRVNYEFKEISLYGPNGKPNWFWDLNPQGTVPVLDCGDEICADSDLILDRIPQGLVDGGEKLLPSASSVKKKVASWRRNINEMLPIGKRAVLGGDKLQLFKKLEKMDAMVEAPYLCGNEVTVADCHAFPFLWRLNTEFDLGATCPNLQKWLHYCEANNPAFSKTVQSSWWWWW